MLGGLAAGAALAPVWPACAKLLSVGRRQVDTFSLSNGLQVVALPSSRAPIVTQLLVYKVGSADEVPGKTGIAHFLEHMMFKGTDIVGPSEFSRVVSKNGGRDNAYTTYDSTGYYQTVSPDRLELVMRMEADRMANLRMTEKELAPERQVVLEERRMRIDNSPSALLDEVVNERLYGQGQPYGMPISGTVADVEALTLADLREFYRQHYMPNNAILIVGGDITSEQVRGLAERYYGPIPARPVGPRRRPDHGASDLPQTVSRADPRVREPRWSRHYLAPSYNKGESQYAYALQVLAQLLGGTETSRLWRVLVVDGKRALSAWAGYRPNSLGLAIFDIGIHPAASVTMAEVESAVTAELGRLIDGGVGNDELERAQNQMLASAIYAQDSLQSGPRIYGGTLSTGSTVADIAAWPERISSVRPDDVVAAARHVWQPQRLVTSLLTPPSGIR